MSDIIWTMKIECVSGWYLEEEALKICEVPSSCALESLCDFILESFDFDHDHMHQFFVSRNARHNRSNTIEDESFTLAEIFPIEKSNFLFMLFDFGDDWEGKRNKLIIINSSFAQDGIGNFTEKTLFGNKQTFV